MMITRFVSAFVALTMSITAYAQEGAPTAQAKKPVVLLVGATGSNGSVVLKQLQALSGQPYEVRAMSRDAASAVSKYGKTANWFEADVLKPETLTKVVHGVDYIIDAKAATGVLGDNRPEAVDLEGTKNMIAAAKASGVKHYVIITSSVSGQKNKFLNLILRDVLIYKGLAEEALISSGLNYTIVGPAAMNNDPPGKQIKLIPRKDYVRGQKITRADTAAVCIEAMTNPDAVNKAFSIHNGEIPDTGAWKQSFTALPAR